MAVSSQTLAVTDRGRDRGRGAQTLADTDRRRRGRGSGDILGGYRVRIERRGRPIRIKPPVFHTR